MSKNFRSIVVTFALCCSLLFPLIAFAVTHRATIPQAYTGRQSTTHSSNADRPYYGRGHHTTSHGGSYPGETNAHHRNGHYDNWRTANRYGVHKTN
jgi:hypothetical protein